MAADKIVPVKIRGYDDPGEHDSQKVPEQIMALETPDDVCRQLV